MIQEIIEAVKNLRREGVRTFLTLLGIVIGIAAIVSLLSIGAGVTSSFERQFESIGTNTVFVSPGNAFSASAASSVQIKDTDISALRSIPNVSEVISEYASSATLQVNGEVKNIVFMSVDKEGYEFFINSDFIKLIDGSWIAPNESGAVMIDKSTAEKGFDKELGVRKQIKINGQEYRIVGIFEMNMQFTGMGNGIAFVTTDGYQKLFSLQTPAEIIIKTSTTESAEQVGADAKEYFEDKYGKKSVTVLTSKQAIEQLGSILSLITIFVAGIAGISLIVGGIGIMNAMITSVLERTREIGVYKAIGASNNKILTIFLVESAFIGAIGGLIGILIGFGLSGIVSIVGTELGFPIEAGFSPEIAIGALAFSTIVGMLSGFYPALRASKLDPVVALRYD